MFLGVGREWPVHMHVRAVPLSEVPRDKAGLEAWLTAAFLEKDQLLTHFYQHGRFPGQVIIIITMRMMMTMTTMMTMIMTMTTMMTMIMIMMMPMIMIMIMISGLKGSLPGALIMTVSGRVNQSAVY